MKPTSALLVPFVLLATGCSDIKKGGGPLPTAGFTADAKPVGLATTLDGSGSSDPGASGLTYKWTIVGKPEGSQVSTFADPAAAMTSFLADRGGDYTVRLTVSTTDGRINAVTNPVHIPNDPAFFVQGDVTASETKMQPGLVPSDGSSERYIGCQLTYPQGTAATSDPRPGQLASLGGVVGSFATGDRFIYSTVVDGGASAVQSLRLATASSDCSASPPIALDTKIPAATGEMPIAYLFPRLSPDGQRVAVLAFAKDTIYLITVGTDGNDVRVVHSFPGRLGALVPPVWVPGGGLAWAEDSGTDTTPAVKLYRGTDAAGAGASATPFHDCASAFAYISQFELLPGDRILLSASPTSRQKTPAGANNLYKQTVGTCDTMGALTATMPGQFAGDFVLNADRSRVYYVSDDGNPVVAGQTPATQLYTLDLGGGTPKKLLGDATTTVAAPRLINGGTQIVFTKLPVASAMATPESSALWIVNADGSGARKLRETSAVAGEMHLTMSGSNLGAGCALGSGAPRSGALLVLALLAWSLRRRRYSRP